MSGTLHKYRVLCTNIGYFAQISGTSHKYRVLCTNIWYYAQISGTLHKYRVLCTNTFVRLWSYLAAFYLKCVMFQNESCRENQNTHFMFNNFFPPKFVPFMT
jgi:hypothetical protein